MDILYIVGTGSNWYNYELKYSLRSLEKYGKNIDNVAVVGFKPHFLNDKIIHIPCEDIGKNKHSRILNKVLTAIKSGKLSDHFLISSDDHFYVKETDFNNFPVYYRREDIEESDGGEYFRSLLETKEFLKQNKLTTYQTNPHCNTHFDVNLYNKYKDLFEAGMKLPDGIEMNCLMGNLMIAEGSTPQFFKDTKIGRFKTKNELIKRIGDTECFSIYDEAIKCGMDKYLKELFPKPSKWEKTLKL